MAKYNQLTSLPFKGLTLKLVNFVGQLTTTLSSCHTEDKWSFERHIPRGFVTWLLPAPPAVARVRSSLGLHRHEC